MTIDDKIRYEKLQCNVNSSKMAALSSGKTEKHECFTGK